MNRLLILLSALMLSTSIYASDGDSTKTTRANYYYVGLQSNLLFRQFLNLTNTSAINNNPYTLNYSSNNKKTGKGFCMGIGFDLGNETTNDGVTQISNRLINFSGRVGFERKYNQQKKWVFYYSSELGAIITNTQTLTKTFNASGEVRTTLETTKIMAGYISRAGVMLKLGEYVTIGTETALNLLVGLNNSSVSSNFTSGTEFKTPFDVGIKTPTAIYITLRY
jgi:hypothetical protein